MKVLFCGQADGFDATAIRALPDLSPGAMPAHAPSLVALTSDDDTRLSAELRVARLRSQVAVIRTVADHIEHLARWSNVDGLREQAVEEMGRLGGRLIGAAAALTDLRRTP
jgi:hypothetical protein